MAKPRAQGGGRTPNSEPRLQVFKEFGGCNFELSPREFTLGVSANRVEQSDLQMNYVVIQNNASLESNKTIQTRNNIKRLFQPPEGTRFTGVALLVGEELFAATGNTNIYYGNLSNAVGQRMGMQVQLTNHNGTAHTWKSLNYYDNKLIGSTQEQEIWMGTYSAHHIYNSKQIPTPSNITWANNLSAKGTLKVNWQQTDNYPFRIGIAYTYVNRFGPTPISNILYFYANKPVSEWSSACYLRINGVIPTGYDVQAIELYYTTDDASTLLFMGRANVSTSATTWAYNWMGYLDATAAWSTANLIAPTENYTRGPRTSRMCEIDGRLYFWGNRNAPDRLYIGGNPGNLFSISPGTGGGFVDIEPGSGMQIRYVDKYKTQSGASIVTMLCGSVNSKQEQRFNLVENNISLSNEQNMKSWQAEQVAGAVGCKSFRGGLVCEDGLYSVSRYGLALTTMTMEYNSQIRVNYISDAIKPAFTDNNEIGSMLRNAILLDLDGVLYLAFGNGTDTELDNMLFCYDIDQKAWWTYTLDVDEPILNLIHIDYEGTQEGIGIITPNAIYLLPTTQNNSPEDGATFNVLIETGELSTQMPQQSWQYLSQMEFRFDHFLGNLNILLVGVDIFGRRVKITKNITYDSVMYNLAEYMRVDLRLQSYKLIISGRANFRLTHFISKVYTMSNKNGLVWGVDDLVTHRTSGDIHPTFKSYNDIRKAIIP